MKELPEIAPELRGLLEEIVADPRSSIRLVPRAALRSWFDTGETARSREVSKTTAERHLIEAHREALAALLCEAASIGFWKAPILAHRPITTDGRPFDEAVAEASWRASADRKLRSTPDALPGTELLRQCLEGIRPEQGLALAQASLMLVPADRTRLFVAVHTPWDRPRTAIAILERIAGSAHPIALRPDILGSLGARLCSVDRLNDAREAYRAACALDPTSPLDRFYAFNLSCFLGEADAAEVEAAEIGKLVGKDDPRVSEARDILRAWARTRTERDLEVASRVSGRLSGTIPEVAAVLCRAFQS